jgi:hypothetical protein
LLFVALIAVALNFALTGAWLVVLALVVVAWLVATQVDRPLR